MKIQTINKIAACGLERLPANFEVADQMDAPDAILVRSAAMHEMVFPESLLAIGRAGAGVNNIPIDRCTSQGIVVFNTPGANANAVKELVLAGLFLASRKVVQGINWVQGIKENGETVAKDVEKGKSAFVGPEIKGKKLGVIGLGAIGVLVANAAQELGMQVYGYDPYLSVDAAWRLSQFVKHAASAEEIYAECDYITIHVPQNDATKGMINKNTIAQMKDGVRILNFARAGLVNTADMKEALAEGKVACYVVDFPEADVLGVENIVAIPHLGASTPESEDNCACMACDEIADYLLNGNITHSVNFPDVVAPRTAQTRICVLHQNIPAILSRVSDVLASRGLNIDQMTSRSRKENSYALLDVQGAVSEELLQEIAAIEGVYRVRAV